MSDDRVGFLENPLSLVKSSSGSQRITLGWSSNYRKARKEPIHGYAMLEIISEWSVWQKGKVMRGGTDCEYIGELSRPGVEEPVNRGQCRGETITQSLSITACVAAITGRCYSWNDNRGLI